MNTDRIDRSKEQTALPKSDYPSLSVGRVLLEATLRLRGSRCLQLLREIAHNPFAPTSESSSKQLARLSHLLAHAEARVPYYREMFRSLGIHSSDIRSLSDFSQLPILTKREIREREPEFLCEGVDPQKLFKGSSGGSTGEPLNFYYDQTTLDASEAATFRNLLQSGWHPGEMIGLFIGFDKHTRQVGHWEFEMRQMIRRMYQFNSFHCGEEEMNGWIRKFRRIGVRVVIGFPSTLARFAKHILETRSRMSAIRGVFTTGEKLFLDQREIIAEAFNCPIYDCYGSSEVRNIATECSHGRMHINTDYVVLETAASSGPPGEPEPIVLTSLWNYVMPFIRYRNEDYGGLLSDTCNCGNNFPLMRLDVGRVSDNFIMPDGRVVHGQFFTHTMYRSEGIANFQFHQTAPDAITLWLVPGHGTAEARERVIQAAVEQIKTLSSLPIKVEVHEVDAIPVSPTGKHRYTRSDVISHT
jgi:phenylacetate-CoA ligase